MSQETTSATPSRAITASEEEEGGLLIFVAWLLLVVAMIAGLLVIGQMGTIGPSYAKEIYWPGLGIGAGIMVQGIVSFAVLSGIAGILRHAGAIRRVIAPLPLSDQSVEAEPVEPIAQPRSGETG
jgi:hypothetical protein